ncbi:hypothetical protein BBO_08328 [Beauveria brongniartii RCEF 3172]|uniref:T6SS Phospholipase effector Tle1-like catalytic domain-containing protein n=1 Tax=Beauveria brongniartii RCEF 3172 TaxID=1081107 RepID=A0A166XT85_9HYPO|nr:hypothetical protein BBO_08328 [Beauveria brongniartii RCEF 3172]
MYVINADITSSTILLDMIRALLNSISPIVSPANVANEPATPSLEDEDNHPAIRPATPTPEIAVHRPATPPPEAAFHLTATPPPAGTNDQPFSVLSLDNATGFPAPRSRSDDDGSVPNGSAAPDPPNGNVAPDPRTALEIYVRSLPKLLDENDQPESEPPGETMKAFARDFERKRLFVCCDGTWNNAAGGVAPMTNVAKLARAVSKVGLDDFQFVSGKTLQRTGMPGDPCYGVVRQVVYYASGIGTQSSLAVDSLFSGAFGKDEIILVGFSRGAFTVRCLAHFINAVGLLRRRGLVFLQSIYKLWQKSAEGKKNASAQLKIQLEALAELRFTDISIKVLAEFDTVSSLRSLRPWKKRLSFVDDQIPENVDHVFHAVALHEKRKSFKPMLWKKKSRADTSVEQCAFVGCHSDVGGGNADPGLSTLSLIWMVSRIAEVCNADFDDWTLVPSISPLRSSSIENVLAPWSWGKSSMRLHGQAMTKGQINESRKGLWLLPYYLTFGTLDGKRDSFLDHFAESRNSSRDNRTRLFNRLNLEPPTESDEKVQQAILSYLENKEKDHCNTLNEEMAKVGMQESSVEAELHVHTNLLTKQRRIVSGLSEDERRELWLKQQSLRQRWLGQEMQDDIGLQIHFTARLLLTRLKSDSRLDCGLYRKYEPNAATQEWHKKSTRTLSLAEASVLEREMNFFDSWLKWGEFSSQNERTKESDLAHVGELENINWTEVQHGLEQNGWGGYVPGCTRYEGLISLIQDEFQRLNVPLQYENRLLA